MSLKEEEFVRSQALLIIARNPSRPHIAKKIYKRFLKCLGK